MPDGGLKKFQFYLVRRNGRDLYSRLTGAGCAEYPLRTEREACKWAKERGGKAVFMHESHPAWDFSKSVS